MGNICYLQQSTKGFEEPIQNQEWDKITQFTA